MGILSMNIVQLILDLITSNGLGKLSSLLGVGEDKAKSAVGAAVPAVLSGLSSLASTQAGAQKLANSLTDLGDLKGLEDLGSVLSGATAEKAEKGSSDLGQLLGGGTLDAILGILSKFLGLGGAQAIKLLGMLTPLILGAIAKQLAGRALTPQGLMGFFDDQKSNIAKAMPAGLSLGDLTSNLNREARVPIRTESAPYPATKTPVAPQEPGMPKWLLPLLGLAALALLAYLFWPKPVAEDQAGPAPENREIARSSTVPAQTQNADPKTALTDHLAAMTTALSKITDADSARSALPSLTDLATKLGGMKAAVGALPEAGKTAITDLIKANTGPLVDQFNRVLMIPGVGDLLRPALDQIVSSLGSLGNLAQGALALPSVEVSKVGSDLVGNLTSLTEALSGIKDAATAQSATDTLKGIESQLDAVRSGFENLPEAGRGTIASMLKGKLSGLKDLVTKVTDMSGIGDTLKPILEAIMAKLAQIAGIS